MKADIYRQCINEAAERYGDELAAIAARARTEVLIPFCVRHGYRFRSGYGVWVLVGEPEYDESLDEWIDSTGELTTPPEGAEELIQVLKVLVDDWTCLAEHMEDYDEVEEAERRADGDQTQ